MNIQKNLIEEPNQTTWLEIISKLFIWILVWWVISVLLFVLLSFIWSAFTQSMNSTWEFVKSNPILPLLLLLIWFMSSFLGNISISWLYGLFFWHKYTNTPKTMWLLLLSNWILFILLAPVYFIFSSDISTLFIIMWFHIIFSIFISMIQSETVSNPNYASSAIIWSTLWFIITLLIYSIVRKSSWVGWSQEQLYLLILLPAWIGFSIIPLFLSIRDAVYYKLYEIWYNWFYTQSKNTNDQNNEEEKQFEDEINIDLN